MIDEVGDYGRGFAFMRLGGGSLPDPGADLREWMKGYVAALADEDPEGSCPSIEAALRGDGVAGDILEKLLNAGEAIERGDDDDGGFIRWPACPVRHSVQALADRDERLARNAGLLDEMG